DRLRLHGWRFDPDTARPLPHCYAICVHGYTGGPEEMAPWAQHYATMGFTVFTPALRAHERSEGRYVTMGALERKDLKQWVNLIVSHDPRARILLHGNSMGAASALLAGADPCHAPNIKAIVSDSAFVGASAQLAHSMADALHAPRALARPSVGVADLLLGRLADASLADADVLDAVRRLTVPTLFIQGDADTIVDPSSARRLYGACASNDCELLVVDGAGHVASLAADPGLYWSTVDAFLRGVDAFGA
ncbi:alpha/beta superfamily hydrolase, partial [Bifidobacterium italicum]